MVVGVLEDFLGVGLVEEFGHRGAGVLHVAGDDVEADVVGGAWGGVAEGVGLGGVVDEVVEAAVVGLIEQFALLEVGPDVAFVLFHPAELVGGVAQEDAVVGMGQRLLGEIDGLALGDHVVEEREVVFLLEGDALARDGGHAVGEQVDGAALLDEEEGAVEIAEAFGVGQHVLVEADDEFVVVAADAHVVVEHAGDEGVDLVVAHVGTKLLGFVEGGAQLSGEVVHVAEDAVDDAIDLDHGGVLHEASEHLHVLGVIGLEVEQRGVELAGHLAQLGLKLVDRGFEEHLVEAVQPHRFGRGTMAGCQRQQAARCHQYQFFIIHSW